MTPGPPISEEEEGRSGRWRAAEPRLASPPPHHAFTLIELIVVTAIIAILVALAFPVTSRIVQGGRATACISNLNSLGVALNLYLGEHNQLMPNLQAGRTSTSLNVPVIDNTLNVYVNDPRVFACPADNLGIAAATGTSYFWNSVLSTQSVTHLRFFNGLNSEIPVLCDKQGFHPYAANKVNLLYADGHATQDLKFVTSQ
jgi:prepilin-type N-terminal cleavage/methylation domain-containing protein/prepilin-type processing-associated H-X9-DG protein